MNASDPTQYLTYQNRYKSGEWRAKVFRDMILGECTGKGSVPLMLDIGCGNGFDDSREIQQELSEYAQRYVGIEPDSDAKVGEYFTSVQHCQFEDCKLETESVDLVFCMMVLEHVRDPNLFWNKLLELLKPKGVFWGFTMDRRHFFCMASMLTERLHIKEWLLNGMRGKRGEERYENFSTFYRANSPKQIRSKIKNRASTQFINFSRIGQLNYYYPKFLVPMGRGIDRMQELLHLPGSLLAVRIQKH